MAKRRDKNDSTMDISASQLVPGNRPQPPGVNKNDVSMWIGGVVGADEFSGAKKPRSRNRAPLIIGVVVLLGAAAGVGYYMFGRASSSPTAAPAPALARVDAGSPETEAVVPVDAATIDAASIDAAVADAGVALAADAVSGADVKPKPTATKKKTTKKTVKKPVKKTTTKHR